MYAFLSKIEMKQNRKKIIRIQTSVEIRLFKLLLFILPFAFGLYYEFTAYIAGMMIAFFLIYTVFKNKRLRYAKQAGAFCLAGSYLFYLITVLFSVDKGLALAGFFKVLPILLFLVLLFQLEKGTVEIGLHVIPYTGLVMLILSAASWLIPPLTGYFYNNDRLGGFFQYSNTFALYLLAGIIILGNIKKKTKATGAMMLVLFAGILLTGSRTIFIFCLLNFSCVFIREKAIRKPMIISAGMILIVVATVVGLTGSIENIGRFLTINLQESTFIGRLLYDKDGLRLLGSHPMGLGYYGYYYLQPSVQTGVYTVRFIHNDWLQFALDAGVMGAVLHFVGLFAGIRKANFMQKQLFVTLVASSFLDFNFQFIIMSMLLMMTLNYESIVEIKKASIQNVAVVTFGILILAWGYMAIAFGLAYFDCFEAAARLYPGNTEARITLLQLSEDKESVNQRANQIIHQNKHIALAYDAKAMVSLSEGDYDKMIAFKKKSIENKKYDISVYEDYIQMLSQAITAENNASNRNKVEAYANEVFAVPEMLQKVKDSTDPLAYKINDKPELELSEVSQEYIKRLREVLK